MTDISLVPYANIYSKEADSLFLELQLHEHQFDSAKTTKPEAATKYRQELVNTVAENSGKIWLAIDTYENIYGLVAWYKEKEIEYDKPYGYISDIIVTKESRNLGIGKLLMEKAINEIQMSGLKRVHIGVLLENSDTKEFYKKFGFKEYSVEMLKAL